MAVAASESWYELNVFAVDLAENDYLSTYFSFFPQNDIKQRNFERRQKSRQRKTTFNTIPT